MEITGVLSAKELKDEKDWRDMSGEEWDRVR